MSFNFSSLKIDPEQFSISILSQRRAARNEEAITWPPGPSVTEKEYYTIWPHPFSGTGYSVRLGKPGKETEASRVNMNDMMPVIFKDDEIIPITGSFTDIFEAIEDLINEDKEAASIMGALLFRSAYMLDHQEVEEGKWRYEISEDAMEFLKTRGTKIYGLPFDVFLAYLDAIGWNEDVKYQTLGYDVTGTQRQNGRLNNMLTYVNIFGVLMNARKVAHVFAGFANGRGISTVSFKKAREMFPFLEVPERMDK